MRYRRKNRSKEKSKPQSINSRAGSYYKSSAQEMTGAGWVGVGVAMDCLPRPGTRKATSFSKLLKTVIT